MKYHCAVTNTSRLLCQLPNRSTIPHLRQLHPLGNKLHGMCHHLADIGKIKDCACTLYLKGHAMCGLSHLPRGDVHSATCLAGMAGCGKGSHFRGSPKWSSLVGGCKRAISLHGNTGGHCSSAETSSLKH